MALFVTEAEATVESVTVAARVNIFLSVEKDSAEVCKVESSDLSWPSAEICDLIEVCWV